MTDIHCVACGEPWDAYGVQHGDMAPWEAALFRKGAGCPCCEGKPSAAWEPTTMAHCENGDCDPMLRIAAREAFERGAVPAWAPPPDTTLWACAGCGVEAVRLGVDPSELQYHLPRGAKGHHWWSSHPFNRSVPDDVPAHGFGGDVQVCEFCLKHCDECGAEVCHTLEYGDCYDAGWCHTEDGRHYYCVEHLPSDEDDCDSDDSSADCEACE